MKTEEIQRTPSGQDPHAVSRALQELAPLSWTVFDRRGRAVPLSSAGYVLRFGQSYRLCIRSPFADNELQEVAIVSPPPFIQVEQEVPAVDEQGRAVRSVPFKVTQDWWSYLTHLRWLGIGVAHDELEVVHRFKPGVFREAPSFLCPIVARPRWTVFILWVVGGLILLLLQRILGGLVSPDWPESLEIMLRTLRSGSFWLWFVGITLAVWLLVTAINLGLLYRRSRELRQHFRARYSD
jgi:hypothetical protein